ncbi:hypothetical protein [Archangium lipolyticum]|uniref:hypothetical protein n=1 Tax=Archangium lipolyticum TaxID=2970465 RepID=UPI002149CBAF|nr:hypothetical protein [Archangium lipolyticum]
MWQRLARWAKACAGTWSGTRARFLKQGPANDRQGLERLCRYGARGAALLTPTSRSPSPFGKALVPRWFAEEEGGLVEAEQERLGPVGYVTTALGEDLQTNRADTK